MSGQLLLCEQVESRGKNLMPCSQCNRPAFYRVGDSNIPLCLDCWHKWQQGMYMQFLQNASMMNFAMDQMDAVVGIPLNDGRIPIAALAGIMNKSSVYNNFKISNSQIGVLNTGDLAKIDAVITLTKDSNVEQIGLALKALTQAVIDAQEIDKESKKEIIDLIQSLGEQIVGSPKQSVIMALLKGIEEKVKTFIALSDAAQKLIDAVNKIFGA